jgi:hypothetical protein
MRSLVKNHRLGFESLSYLKMSSKPIIVTPMCRTFSSLIILVIASVLTRSRGSGDESSAESGSVIDLEMLTVLRSFFALQRT